MKVTSKTSKLIRYPTVLKNKFVSTVVALFFPWSSVRNGHFVTALGSFRGLSIVFEVLFLL